MTKICKTAYTVTVLHVADEPLRLMNDLQYVLDAMNTGNMVGQWDRVSTEVVPSEKVVEELEAVGNDGVFFNEEMEG